MNKPKPTGLNDVLSALGTYSDDLLDVTLPPRFTSGVYFLMDGDEVVYIGKSTDCEARAKSHYKASLKRFDRMLVLPLAVHRLDEVETHLIARFRPKYNVSVIPNAHHNINLHASIGR